MRPAPLCLSFAVLCAACTSLEPSPTTLQVAPLLAVRHGGPDATAYYRLGRYHQTQLRDHLAEAAYEKALALDATHVDVLNALGSLYATRGELPRAIALYERLTELSPQSAFLLNNLGYAELLNGQAARAYAHLRGALLHDPAYGRAWANLEALAAIHGADPSFMAALKSRQIASLPASLSDKARGGAAQEQPPEPRPRDEPLAAGKPTLHAAGAAPLPPLLAMPPLPAASPAAVSPVPAALVEVFTLPDRGETRVAEPQCRAGDNAGTTAYRLEIANGNGVTGFARRFTAQLRHGKVEVARVTNYRNYRVSQSVVEYQPGYAAAACALLGHLGVPARLGAARSTRPGTDIRLILGGDALRGGTARAAWASGGVQARKIVGPTL